MFTSLLRTTEKEQKALHDEWLKTAIEYKSDWEHTLERRKAHGIVAPDPIPHPDDIIIINMRTGEVHIKGPMTKEEKVQWRFRQRKDARSDQPIDLAARSANFVKLEMALKQIPTKIATAPH